ncbi:MAG TPA: isoprenylcysteine carboxylmethyltransferase family protein [Panacibacter sp.]|nr:isoprenylcysteine carboxylmethyltransferase family protein [Panacibacter sp.]
MTIFDSLIAICWFIFICVWIFYSSKVKKNIRENDHRRYPLIRLIITTTVVILLFNIKGLQYLASYHIFPSNNLVQGIGVLICTTGISFAIWARVVLGRNWGMPMQLKEKPDLVTTGPYYLIRHPIYTGILIAMFGSMVATGFMWLVWFLLFSTSFVFSAKKEEKHMLAQFPKEYAEYMKRTKMLIPFLF